MRVEIITPYNGEIMTVQDLKDSQRIDGNQEDDFLETLISTARNNCENFLRRTLLTTGLKAYFKEWSELKYLPFPPVQSVESISYYDANGDLKELDESFYVVKPGEFASISLAPYQIWPCLYPVEEAIIIEYTAGYADKDESPVVSGSGVPTPIIHAIKMHAGHLYTSRESMNINELKPVGMAYESLLEPYVVPFL